MIKFAKMNAMIFDYEFVFFFQAVVLSKYIVDSSISFRGHKIIELGAGTGLAGIVASLIGSSFSISVVCFVGSFEVLNIILFLHATTRVICASSLVFCVLGF